MLCSLLPCCVADPLLCCVHRRSPPSMPARSRMTSCASFGAPCARLQPSSCHRTGYIVYTTNTRCVVSLVQVIEGPLTLCLAFWHPPPPPPPGCQCTSVWTLLEEPRWPPTFCSCRHICAPTWTPCYKARSSKCKCQLTACGCAVLCPVQATPHHTNTADLSQTVAFGGR